MQPATTSARRRPDSRSSATSRIAFTDSSRALSMNAHVFTTATSASSSFSASAKPEPASVPSITSVSRRFFGQPRLWKWTVALGVGDDMRGGSITIRSARLRLAARSACTPRYPRALPSQSEGSAVSDRPFRVLGLQQIAVGGLDKARLRQLWVDTLGLEPVGSFRSERENVDEDIAVAGSGPLKVEVDLIQPLDPAKSPKVHEPALNHVGLWIDDLAAAVAWLEGRGVRFTPGGIRKGASG